MSQESEFQLPAAPEEITPSWLSAQLGFHVKDASITAVNHGTTSMVFMDLTYDDAQDKSAPTNICVKGGFNPKRIAEHPWILSIYHREADFFKQIAPTLHASLRLPRCWWAANSTINGVIIMDDLSKAGYTFGDPEETWDVDRVIAGVEQLAILHASMWGLKPEEYTWITPHYDQAILSLMGTWEQVVTSPGRPAIPDFLKSQERVTKVLKTHYASRDPRFQCLLHGDTHIGNTFVTPQGQPGFLDYQMIHFGSVFHDVAYFVASALPIEVRRAEEMRIIQQYLTQLAKFGGPEFSIENVMKEYAKSYLAGIGWIMCPFDWQKKERVICMAERYIAAIEDHKVFEILES